MPSFPPISEYAFLSDCETTALLAPNGAVEWMCVPRMDSASVFSALLDRDAGRFSLGPAGGSVPVARRYLPGTLVLETTWMTSTGWLVVRDALLVGPWGMEDEPAPPYRRPPRGERAEHVLLRAVECPRGAVDVVLECRPRFAYGRQAASWSAPAEAESRAEAQDGSVALALRTDLGLEIDGDVARATRQLREGERGYAALSWAGRSVPRDAAEAEGRIERTVAHWRDWLGGGSFPDHPWRHHLQRSALTLKGLVYLPTGAMVAAATTSLPETIGGERNWDYRYTWVRDSTFLLWGLYTLGLDSEAEDFFSFLVDACESDDGLQIMYGIGGERELEERTLDHLGGYEGSRPVRVGNAAFDQPQHDVWGVVVDSVYLHTKSTDDLPDRLWRFVERQVEKALDNWRLPDRGMWEVRGEPKHFTSSKVLCWVAADRGARLALRRGETGLARRWERAAGEIKADVLAHGVDERGVFTQHYDTQALDASNLLIPLVRFLAPGDARVSATVLAIADELGDDGLVLRYRVKDTDDGLSGEEGAFTICSFWLVSALAEIGEPGRARRVCEKLLSYAGPLGLYAEELEPHSGRHLGNFPQAFSHLALINAVIHVIRAERAGSPGDFSPVKPVRVATNG